MRKLHFLFFFFFCLGLVGAAFCFILCSLVELSVSFVVMEGDLLWATSVFFLWFYFFFLHWWGQFLLLFRLISGLWFPVY